MGAPLDVQRRLLTVDDYHRMGTAEILQEDDRVELVEGELIEMPPIGERHVHVVALLNRDLVLQVRRRAVVSPQGALKLPPFNEFQPDILLVKPEWATERVVPGASHALLAVEVSDTTLQFDRNVKLPIYARYAVPELWIFDVEHETSIVHRDPEGSSYRSEIVVENGGSISPLALPDVRIDLSKVYL